MDDNIKNKIISTIENKLNRKLNQFEFEAFLKTRSFIAYEMIFDTVSNSNISQDELEKYIKSVTNEFLEKK